MNLKEAFYEALSNLGYAPLVMPEWFWRQFKKFYHITDKDIDKALNSDYKLPCKSFGVADCYIDIPWSKLKRSIDKIKHKE